MVDEDVCKVANALFLKLANARGIMTNPGDFVSLSLCAMKVLQDHHKANLVYKFTYCLANKRSGTEEPIFPLDRMPFGLVAYQIEFFACTNIMQVST